MSRTPRAAFLLTIMVGACAAAPPTKPPAPLHAAPEPATQKPITAAGAPSDPLDALPKPAADAPCRIRGEVEPRDVSLALRTRLDAVPSMTTRKGSMTAWLQNEWRQRHDGPNAIVEIENEAMRVRALVSPDDLHVALAQPIVVDKSWVPDGVTDRPVRWVEPSWVRVEIGLPTGATTALDVHCEDLSLRRRDLDLAPILAGANTETMLRSSARLSLPSGGELAITTLSGDFGGHVQGGVLARLLHDDPRRPTVAIRGCGGTVFGTVAKTDLQRPPEIRGASSAHCPDTGRWVFEQPAKLVDAAQCAVDIPAFIATSTLEDPIGVLKAHAVFHVDAQNGRMALITVGNAPVDLAPLAHFSVRQLDIATCTGQSP